MAFKTKRPEYSSQNTDEKLTSLIGYVENLSEEIEFKLDSLSKSQEKIKRLRLSDTSDTSVN